MNVILKPEADEVLYEVSEFVEGINTEGSGKRWLDKIRTFLFIAGEQNLNYTYNKLNILYSTILNTFI